MQTENLSLSNVLRYIGPIVIVYIYLYICDAPMAKQAAASLGVTETISLIILGSVIYILYKSIFYNLIILRLQDICRLRTDNYRTFLKKRYDIGTYEAMHLWIQIREKYFKDRYYGRMLIPTSEIHLLYIMGIAAIPFSTWRFRINDFELSLLFLVIAPICFLVAFIYDRQYENMELRFLRSLDDNEMDLFASKMLRNSSLASNKENNS